MKAAIHLGPNYKSNAESYKNTKFEDIESVFSITQKLGEVLGVFIPSWAGSVLANDQAIKLARKILTKLKTEVVQLLVSPPTSATGNRMPERVQSFEELIGQIHLTQLFEKTFFQYLVTSGKRTKFDQKRTTGTVTFFVSRILEFSILSEYLCARTTHFLDLFLNPKSWQLFPKAQSLDQSCNFIL